MAEASSQVVAQPATPELDPPPAFGIETKVCEQYQTDSKISSSNANRHLTVQETVGVTASLTLVKSAEGVPNVSGGPPDPTVSHIKY